MAYNLTIDCGNSFSKLALWDGHRCVADTSVMGLPEMADVIGLTRGVHVAAAALCSVSGADTSQLLRFLEAVFPKVSVLDHNTPTPLSNCYDNPERLGVDRLAAACGAAALVPGKTLLVVDMGTAVTYDVVSPHDGDTLFIGGNIAPGLGLRLRTLAENTGLLPLIDTPDEFDAAGPVFADNTEEAILNGCVRGIAAETLYYSGHILEPHTIVLTGYHAPLVMPLLDRPDAVYDAHLVGRGLNSIILNNEK